MTKWVKRLLSLAAIGSAAAGLIYYFKKIYKGPMILISTAT